MMLVFAVTSFVAGPLYGRLGAAPGGVRGRSLSRDRHLLALAARRRLVVRVARARHGRARHRRRALLLVDHDGRGHRARPVAVEPRRRHRLHVPDRRRRGRPRVQHRDRRVGIEPDRRHQRRLQGRRRARGRRLPARARGDRPPRGGHTTRRRSAPTTAPTPESGTFSEAARDALLQRLEAGATEAAIGLQIGAQGPLVPRLDEHQTAVPRESAT